MKYSDLNILSFMSGSSLDGMDIGLINIRIEKGAYSYKILKAETVTYSNLWIKSLSTAQALSGEDLIDLDFSYGKYCAEKLNTFKSSLDEKVDFVSYHGHTIFHKPSQGYTFALGNLAAISANTSMKIIGQYRDSDISLQGQGAPLMAIADKLLFRDFQVNVNLGGICNLSVNGQKVVAYDLCPCNQLFNKVYQRMQIPFDDKGKIARTGFVVKSLLERLNSDEYYKRGFPKSLDNNHINNKILPFLDGANFEKNQLFTLSHFVASIIGKELQKLMDQNYVSLGDNILLTGGGALNDFLVSKIKEKADSLGLNVVVPSEELINFKELILMALLGFMRVNGVANILNTATGSTRSSNGGGIYES